MLSENVSKQLRKTVKERRLCCILSKTCYKSVLVPLCWGLESADRRFMSVTTILCVIAGEQGRSGLQGGADGVMREGHGEGHGEGRGDG